MTENPIKGKLRPLLSGAILRSQTDERLCALVGAGNEQAFGAIFERYRRELRAHAGRIVRPDRADDVVQQAMLGAWSALLAGTHVADVRPWLHRVVHNAAIDTVTRRGYDDAELPLATISPALTEERVEGRLHAEAALVAVATLPASQRRALTLTAIEGRSGRDAALAMGISEGAMRQLIHRARSGVRAAVTAITPMPLIELLGTAGGAPATPAVIGLGTAGGVGALAKIGAVIGVSVATLGAAHALHPHRRAGYSPHAPASQVSAKATSPEPIANGPTIQPATLSKPVKLNRHSAGRHPLPASRAAHDRRGSSSGRTPSKQDRQSTVHETSNAGDIGSGPPPASQAESGKQENTPASDQATIDQAAIDGPAPQQADALSGPTNQ